MDMDTAQLHSPGGMMGNNSQDSQPLGRDVSQWHLNTSSHCYPHKGVFSKCITYALNWVTNQGLDKHSNIRRDDNTQIYENGSGQYPMWW